MARKKKLPAVQPASSFVSRTDLASLEIVTRLHDAAWEAATKSEPQTAPFIAEANSVPVVPSQRRTPRQKVNTELGKWRKAHWKKVGKAAHDAGHDNYGEFFTLLTLAEVPVRPDLKGDSWQKAYAIEPQQGQIRTMKSHALAAYAKSKMPR